MKRPAAFLDRDGVLNVERGFVTDPIDLVVPKRVPSALRRLADAGFACVVCTNQSGLARGLLDWRRFHEIQIVLRTRIRGRIERVYVCPHHPRAGCGPMTRACPCRKPAPGLLLRAGDELDLDLERSVMIGDAPRDVEAAAALGVPAILVCGPKLPDPALYPGNAPAPIAFVYDLDEAVNRILGTRPLR